MINKIKEFMSNQVEETSTKKDKKKKETEEIQNLHQEIESLKTELEESKDKYLRLFAEFDNFKKRSVKERFELMKTAAQETITSLLPILDDFDRAKKSAETGAENFSEGVQLVYHKLFSTMEHKGLRAMDSTGKDFDPEYHEAITDIPAPSDEMKGKVIDTVEKGYTLNDKIIRYAKVVVAK
ncbi:MAG: nucleotide exchange factor GrpE [Saprospiraceae bacterium]|nr:nucleotide exchange factor GrpE [Saprospiraceae bacterium]MBK8669493.1 nucleotide exchange factor GrpE [Saprospiraceae bacterium]MBL0098913.1 nucleotide exchange factor GrpE [Saprospiraceae bacterium]